MQNRLHSISCFTVTSRREEEEEEEEEEEGGGGGGEGEGEGEGEALAKKIRHFGRRCIVGVVGKTTAISSTKTRLCRRPGDSRLMMGKSTSIVALAQSLSTTWKC